MLFNPNWKKPDNDVLSPNKIIAWLEKKPADEVYEYNSSQRCILNQYLRASGVDVRGVGEDYYRTKTRHIALSKSLAFALANRPRTHGGLIDRLRLHSGE